jgi:hypothetical protein
MTSGEDSLKEIHIKLSKMPRGHIPFVYEGGPLVGGSRVAVKPPSAMNAEFGYYVTADYGTVGRYLVATMEGWSGAFNDKGEWQSC